MRGVYMKKVLYLGRFGLPESAAGIRVYRIAKLLSACGCRVRFGCYGSRYSKAAEIFDGYAYNFLIAHRGVGRMLNAADLYCDLIKYRFARQLIQTYQPDMVILYNPTCHIANMVRRYCRKLGISVVVDVTEWYEIAHCQKGEKVVARSVDKRIRTIDSKMDGIIAISPYLADYYRKMGQRVYEIPPMMMEIGRGDYSRSCSEDGALLTIVYAGLPGRKDQLDQVLCAVEEINRDRVKIHLDVVGVSAENGTPGICFYGRLPHDKAVDVVRKADFSVLFRENLRYAKAGFSTKFSESMSLGVPLICNSVGGCDALISSMQNGIVVEDGSIETIRDCLLNLLEQPDTVLENMKKGAIQLAAEHFSFEVNQKTVNNMLADLIKGDGAKCCKE